LFILRSAEGPLAGLKVLKENKQNPSGFILALQEPPTGITAVNPRTGRIAQ
jgi:hypothetical protein